LSKINSNKETVPGTSNFHLRNNNNTYSLYCLFSRIVSHAFFLLSRLEREGVALLPMSLFLLLLSLLVGQTLLFVNPVVAASDENNEEDGFVTHFVEEDEGGIPIMGILSNDKKIPLVGLGVGTLQHYMVPLMVAAAIQEDKNTKLFDTSRVTENEHLIAQGIHKGMERRRRKISSNTNIVTVHVVTKVWYTHLGYERTKLSIQESLEALQEATTTTNNIDNNNEMMDLRVHLMLHWPRCYDNVPWMNCEEDENAVSEAMKQAGPPPHLDKNNAWKESWRAFEEIYLSSQTQQEFHGEKQTMVTIDSIGVSNFQLNLMNELQGIAQVPPHILQINVWSLLYDPLLIDHCHKHKIHIQVYNVMSSIFNSSDHVVAPNAYQILQKVAADLSSSSGVTKEYDDDDALLLSSQKHDDDDYDNETEVSPGQVVLAWLVQHGVSVIPRTSRLSRLKENSAVSIASIHTMTDSQVEMVAHAVEAFLSGEDVVLLEEEEEERKIIIPTAL